MSDQRQREDERLLGMLAEVFTEDGELLPTEANEVVRAEADGVEDTPLPAGLDNPYADSADSDSADSDSADSDSADSDSADSDSADGDSADGDSAGAADVVHLDAVRRRRALSAKRFPGWLSHGAALLLGAAAAAAWVIQMQPQKPKAAGTPASTDSATVRPPDPTIALSLSRACTSCCAGAACDNPRDDLKKCASGRQCVACDRAELAKSSYRLRLGGIAPTQLARDAFDKYKTGILELCVRAGTSHEVCITAHTQDMPKEVGWMRPPLVVSGDDLAAKIDLRLQWKGAPAHWADAARWTMPVPLSPSFMCKGYLVQLKDKDGEVFATTSLFVDDTHFVEMMRSDRTATLLAHHQRLRVDGGLVALRETTRPGTDRFVLTLGPFDAASAEALRWQLLDQKQDAVTTLGSDYKGKPRKLSMAGGGAATVPP